MIHLNFLNKFSLKFKDLFKSIRIMWKNIFCNRLLWFIYLNLCHLIFAVLNTSDFINPWMRKSQGVVSGDRAGQDNLMINVPSIFVWIVIESQLNIHASMRRSIFRLDNQIFLFYTCKNGVEIVPKQLKHIKALPFLVCPSNENLWIHGLIH